MGSMISNASPPEIQTQPRRRILFIDAYDSFTNNIVSLLTTLLDVEVHVIHNDLRQLDSESAPWTEAEFLEKLRLFDAVVCGPGPGSPYDAKDNGAFQLLWTLADENMMPVLGICLGFQSLVASFGGRVRKLTRGLHGMVREIEHRSDAGADIFDHVTGFRATLYHSLCADIGQHKLTDYESDRWMPSESAPELVPLAWVTEQMEGVQERILMAVKHRTKPFWGLQYHPESVCTEKAGNLVLKNWFESALRWNLERGRIRSNEAVEGMNLLRPSLLHHTQGFSSQHAKVQSQVYTAQLDSLIHRALFGSPDGQTTYFYREVQLPDGFGAPEVVEALGLGNGDSIILDSSSAENKDVLAKNSIIAVGVDQEVQITYHVGDNSIAIRSPELGECFQTYTPPEGTDVGSYIWEVMSHFWNMRKDPAGSKTAPSIFKGGFMGFVTYEWGLSRLDDKLVADARGHHRPDVCFAWVTRSVVLNHEKGVAYVQELRPSNGSRLEEQEGWIDSTVKRLETSPAWVKGKLLNGLGPLPATGSVETKDPEELHIETPSSEDYHHKVRLCQDRIAAGDSYELCLTGQTTMSRPRGDDCPEYLREATDGNKVARSSPWRIYRTLRQRQPAPFGSFIRLGGATLLSSSPERFLTHTSDGLCSMRPMKGTVRKSEAVRTLAQAEKILHIPKEEAENLMIVDLVRHDLHGVCGAGNVQVPELLKVEEYATVFTMVSVINGQLPKLAATESNKEATKDGNSANEYDRFTGLDALAASLPPGSMTGAPKKRSCQILKELEGSTERSLYSGVVGYMDVTGQGDWSVTIRSMFRWDEEKDASLSDREVWHIGAGGAVTILSTPEGEKDEMLTKLAGPLGVWSSTA